MKKILAVLIASWFASIPAYASFTVYAQDFEDFVKSRNLVFKGTVLSVSDLEEFDKEEYDKERKPYPKQIAKVRIDEILKKPLSGKRFKEGQTIELEVESTRYELRLAGIYYHDPGSEAFWMLKSRKENYGLDTERATRWLNWRDRIENSIRGKSKKKK